MLVDRFRKEQVRKEIHDTRLKDKQESQKKLQLLSLQDQRELEKKERLKSEKEKEAIEKKKIEDQKSSPEKISGDRVKEIKKKLTPSKKPKLRKINLTNIRSEISQPGSTKFEKSPKGKTDKSSKNVETKVKETLAAIGTKKKKKVYRIGIIFHLNTYDSKHYHLNSIVISDNMYIVIHFGLNLFIFY